MVSPWIAKRRCFTVCAAIAPKKKVILKGHSMKKFVLLLVLLLTLSAFSSCGEDKEEGELKIVCSVFPLYDWTREIVGESDALSLELLVDSGTDMHSYQASVGDIITLTECDLFIYVGGASDAWAEEALRSHENPNRVELRLLDYIECEDLSCHSGEGHDHTHEAEGYDEHIWLSLRNAARVSAVIADAIASLDPLNASLYLENSTTYIDNLNALDAFYAEAFQACAQRVLLFADRFPFVYLTRDYEILCFAAFSGCSSESEASAATVRTLAVQLDEYGLSSVLILEDSSDSIADAVIAASKSENVSVLSVDSMQSVSEADIRGGVRYLTVMEKNLALFLEAMQ